MIFALGKSHVASEDRETGTAAELKSEVEKSYKDKDMRMIEIGLWNEARSRRIRQN